MISVSYQGFGSSLTEEWPIPTPCGEVFSPKEGQESVVLRNNGVGIKLLATGRDKPPRWLALAICGLACSCGAPLKSADQTQSLFGATPSLQAIETSLCENIAAREEAPTLKGLNFDLQSCQRSGLGAVDFSKIKSLVFLNVDGTSSASTTTSAAPADRPNKVQTNSDTAVASTSDESGMSYTNRQIRAQVWLNRPFLNMAGGLTDFIKTKQATAGGAVELPDQSQSAFAEVAKTALILTKAPTLNLDGFSFSMDMLLSVSGLVTVEQALKLEGKMVENNFPVVIRSVKNAPYSKSLIRDLKIVMLIIPYANDVYIDIFTDINVYNIGMQVVLDEQLNAFLGATLKSMLDALMTTGGR